MNTRQTIIDKLETRIKSLSEVRTVSVWQMMDFAASEFPVVLIKDTIDLMPSDGVIGKIDHELTVEMTALFFGKTIADKARAMVATLMDAIGDDKTFAGNAYDTVVNSAEIDLDDSGKLLSKVTLDLTIYYRSDLWTI